MKKVVSFLLIIIIAINIVPPVSVAAAATKGTVNSVNWSYSKGVLTISLVKGSVDYGNWLVYDNSWYGEYPWESHNSKITKIVFKSGIKRIPYGVFRDLGKLKEVQMANTIESIDSEAFSGCKKLKTLKLSKKLTDIGYNAFHGCVSLTDITLPAGLKTISSSAFAYCSGLKSITIPDGVVSIGSSAFEGCASLKSAVLPKIMKEIPYSLFSGCGDLETVELPHNLEAINYNAFNACNSLKSITLPAGVTSISGGMFASSEMLGSVVIPASLNGYGIFSMNTELYFNSEHAYGDTYHDKKRLSVILEEQTVSVNKGEKVKINAYYPSTGAADVPASMSWDWDYDYDYDYSYDYNYDWEQEWTYEDWPEDWSEDWPEDLPDEPTYDEKYNLEYPGGTDVTINYVSLNPDIADVSSDGTVTAKKGGIVQIKAYVDDKNYAMCRVDVVSPTKSISAESIPEYISVNEVYQLDVKVSPADSTQGIEYKVSGTKCNVSSEGELRAYTKGTFTLTVTSGAVSQKYKIVIENPKLNFDSKQLTAGYTIKAKVKNTKRDVSWQSSNPSVLKVDDKGKLTGLKQGYSCVIAQVGSMKYYCEVNVISPTQKKILALQDKYPHGYYWNNNTPSKKYPAVTEIPCYDHASGAFSMCKGQCAGFAALMSNEIYGANAPRHRINDINSVRTGDYIRYGYHSIFIIDVVKQGDIIGYNKFDGTHIYSDRNYWTVVHCNWDYQCNIRWFDDLTITEIIPSESYRRTL